MNIMIEYLRLMRFHKPVGIVLLWVPTALALWMAAQGYPDVRLVGLFLAGTIIMRAAGCVMNDIADRHIDGHVARTAYRPLASGFVSLKGAIGLLFVLLLLALCILLQLPVVCWYYATFALFVTAIYPFCKRFMRCPQLVLGIAFSLGIPMAFAASGQFINSSMFLLLIINSTWIIAYDTQYAMVDRADDLLIGIYSSAILFGRYDRLIIGCLQFISHGLWIVLALIHHFSGGFFILWGLSAIIFIYQQYLLSTGNKRNFFKAFSSNSCYGLLLWAGVVIGQY